VLEEKRLRLRFVHKLLIDSRDSVCQSYRRGQVYEYWAGTAVRGNLFRQKIYFAFQK